MYNDEVLRHFQRPHNYGKIKNPDGLGMVGNVVCGDVMWLYIKVSYNKQKEEIIKEIKFETFGCVAAIATSSAVTDLAKGKTLEAALKITKNDIIDSLGDLPVHKKHCSVLANDALFEAIYDYYGKQGRKMDAEAEKRHKQLAADNEEIEGRLQKRALAG